MGNIVIRFVIISVLTIALYYHVKFMISLYKKNINVQNFTTQENAQNVVEDEEVNISLLLDKTDSEIEGNPDYIYV